MKFASLNILATRGKVANYKNVIDDTVVVKDIKQKDETTLVVLEKKDSSKFFGYLKNVKSNYSKSIEKIEFNTVN